MDFRHLRAFIAVAEEASVTKAAERLHISQPPLSRHIKQLEDELGGELIRREGRNSHLTDLGNRMRPLLQQCYDSALTAKSLATKLSKGEVSSLSIAVSHTLDLDLLLGALGEVQRAFAGLQLRVRRGTGVEICEMLKNGEVELAISGPLGAGWERIDSWPMFTEDYDLIVGADDSLASLDCPDLDVELVRESRLLLYAGCDPAELAPDAVEAQGLSHAGSHHVDSVRDLETLIAAKFGFGIMPASTMKSPRVRHLRCSALDLKRTVAIYSVSGRARSREAGALLNLLRATDWAPHSVAKLVETAH